MGDLELTRTSGIHISGAEREPSNARLPEVSEYDFTLQTDGRNYNIDVFFQSTSEWREGGERSEPSAS